MNCPICKSGVMELLGYVNFDVINGGEIVINHSYERSEKSFPIYVCSVDICSHVETAAPGILITAKRLKKQGILLYP